MKQSVNLIQLYVTKFDRLRHISVETRFTVPIDANAEPLDLALRILTLAYLSGTNQSFALRSSQNQRQSEVAFYFENPVSCLPSIAITHQSLDKKQKTRLGRYYHILQTGSFSTKGHNLNKNCCLFSDNLLGAVSEAYRSRMQLDLFIDGEDVTLTVNNERCEVGETKNGQLLQSAIVESELKLAS